MRATHRPAPAVLGPAARRAGPRRPWRRASRPADERADQMGSARRYTRRQRSRRLRQGHPHRDERGLQGHRGGSGHRVLPGGAGLLRGDQLPGRRARPHDRRGRPRRQLRAAPVHTQHAPALEKEHVFFLSNYVGTPTLTRALPVIKRYADQQVILVGNFTGAQPQREAPYGRARLQHPRLLSPGDGGARRPLLGAGAPATSASTTRWTPTAAAAPTAWPGRSPRATPGSRRRRPTRAAPSSRRT